MKIRKNGRILNNSETPKIMPYKIAITPPLLSNNQIDSCLSRYIYIYIYDSFDKLSRSKDGN